MIRALFLIGLLFALQQNVGASERPDCRSDTDLDYICGPEKPEDVVAIPGTKWMIASGFSPGAGLKLVDVTARTFERWYEGKPSQIGWDHKAFRECPGPVDPKLFNARGLSLRQIAPGRWRLLVVNHGGRESVELFDISLRKASPQILWRGCIPMPPGEVGNSVASFSDGTILVTVLTRPGTSIADFVQGKRTGGVWQHRPHEAGFSLLPGTDLPGNNGIETDPDDRHFYVIAFGWRSVVIFDRRDTNDVVARIETADFMPDNIHWTGGRLLLAGMRWDEPACGGTRKIVGGVADPMRCHRGWVVGELDPVARRISTVAYGSPQAGFNGLSAAALVNGELWLGSYQASRIAVIRRGDEGTDPVSGPQ